MSPAIVSRTADSYLRLVRLPINGVLGLLPGKGSAAKLSVDRADAAIRRVAGRMLRDPALVRDAELRRVATDERADAVQLRARAEREAKEADARLEEDRARADRERQQAARAANERKAEAKRKRAANVKRANAAARERTATSRRSAAKAKANTERREPVAQRKVLAAKTTALTEREKALTTADEARRLERAAARAKRQRKTG